MYVQWMLTLPFNRTLIAISMVKLRHDVQLENHPTASSVYWHDRLPILGDTAQNILLTQKGRVVYHKCTKYTNFGLTCDIHHRCLVELLVFFTTISVFF